MVLNCTIVLMTKVPRFIASVPGTGPVLEELSPESVQTASGFASAAATHEQNRSIEAKVDDFGFQLRHSKQKVCLDSGVLQADYS